MADAYLSVAAIADDPSMLRRVTSCAAQQKHAGAAINTPEAWAVIKRYTWASSPSWGEKWDSALISHEGDADYQPGADPAVITDGDILSTVQAIATAEPDDPPLAPAAPPETP